MFNKEGEAMEDSSGEDVVVVLNSEPDLNKEVNCWNVTGLISFKIKLKLFSLLSIW